VGQKSPQQVAKAKEDRRGETWEVILIASAAVASMVVCAGIMVCIFPLALLRLLTRSSFLLLGCLEPDSTCFGHKLKKLRRKVGLQVHPLEHTRSYDRYRSVDTLY